MKIKKTLLYLLAAVSICGIARGDDKTAVGKQDNEKVQLEEPKDVSVDKSLKDLPDGVLKVKTNPDGSFKSLIIKATVEIEDTLGAQKGKRLARSEAEVQCKRLLSQWLKESCAFAETQAKVTTIVTKGESSKDAAGNKVTIRNQKAQEIKVDAEGYVSASTAVLKGLIVLQSEVTDQKEFVLVMGLSQTLIDQANAAKAALTGDSAPSSAQGPGSKTSPDNDVPAPEKKTNPEADEFLK
jgi:hypothetical protein